MASSDLDKDDRALNFDLSDEQIGFQSMAREFADGEIRPIAERLDRSQQLFQDFPWALVKKGSEIGFRTVALPTEYGGLELGSQTWVVLIDELGYPDIACAKIFSQNWILCRTISAYGTQEQKERVLSAFRDDDSFLIGYAEVESENDGSLSNEIAHGGIGLSAKRVGDQYLLNGNQSFVSLGPVAKLLLVNARLEGSSAELGAGSSTFLVPSDLAGVSVNFVDDRVGMRVDLQGRVVFDNVRIPAENLLGGKQQQSYGEVFDTASDIEISALAMTVARAALDAATIYATERIQGGQRIIEHQAVALTLAEMFITLQAGRSFLWRVAWKFDNNQSDRALTKACKIFCTEAAVDICHEALELFGGAGVMRELPIQKYFRDSLTLLHMAGANHANRAQIGAILAARSAGGQRLS